MAAIFKSLPKATKDLIAAEAPKINARRRSYQTAGMTEAETANIALDVAADNARVLAFLGEEEDMPWWQQSPWGVELLKEQFIRDWITICGWHFRELGNPIFVFRALVFGRFLSARHGETLAWAHEYLSGKAITKPLDNKNANSLRKALAAIRDDELYLAVARLVNLGGRVGESMKRVAEAERWSYPTVRGAYYRIRKLADQPWPKAKHAPLLRIMAK